MADEIKDAIVAAAQSPLKASADGVSVDARPMADLIAADKHIAAKEAAKVPGLGFRMVKLVPPGTV